MVRGMITLLAAFLAVHSAGASVYDDYPALLQKFGVERETLADPAGIADKILVFEKDKVRIQAHMLAGKVARIEYKKETIFNTAETDALLVANAPNRKKGDWLADTKKKNDVASSMFVRVDRNASAEVKWNVMTVTSRDYYAAQKRLAERRNRGLADKLKNF